MSSKGSMTELTAPAAEVKPEPAKRRPLQVLFVDDDDADVELQHLALRRDFAVGGKRVDTAAAFVQEVRRGEAQVILCDYEMPTFSGMEALKLWHSLSRPVPFLFVTGRLSEELAVECLKAGATDYVLKGNLVRLPTAIDRALREFEAARAMRHLEAERSRIATAVDQADEAMIITGPDGTIVYVNPAFSRVTGYAVEEAIGQNPRLLRSGLQPESLYGALWRRIQSGQVWRGQLVNRRRDGTLYDAELTIAPVFDERGVIANFVGVQRDVTARTASERHLRELNVKLAETDRLKDEFLAAFSHELRTPLNIIVGYTDLLLESSDEEVREEPRRLLGRVRDSAVNLTALIDETLDLARLRIGALQIKSSTVDVAALVRDVVDGLRPIAEQKHLRLDAEIGEQALEAEIDPVRLRQIVSNLVENAIKFTEAGEVKVQLTANRVELAIEVRDTGIGIATADVPHIFEDFRQLDGSASSAHGGCGLGLALTSRLLELMGGDITVDSVPGRGSCFAVSLPRQRLL